MENYPWKKSFQEMYEFEAKNSQWICDVPQLSRNDVSNLVKKCLITDAIPASALLSHALDQKNLSKKDADKAFDYIKNIYLNLLLCFGSISLSPNLSTEKLIWMASRFDENEDPYIHSIGNLIRRISHDTEARDFLKQQISQIKNQEVKDWLVDSLSHLGGA